MKNTFENGLLTDALDELQPPGSYRFAWNAVTSSRYASSFGLTNELDRTATASLPATIVGKTSIEERNQTLLFLSNGELHLYNHDTDTTTFVCSDSEFGCNWNFSKCEYKYGEFKHFNKCNELHVYWSSDCTYHVVNIDEMLDPVRKACVKANEDCTYFDIFKCICGPRISAFPVDNPGATLEGGAYNFAIQLTDYDGNDTNVFDLSQSVYIETENNAPGEVGKQTIRLHIDSLDPRYNRVIIYVAQTTADVTVVKRFPAQSYGDQGITFNYYGQKGELVDVAALINKSKAFLRGQDLIQKDGRMFFYNLKNENNLNYQKYANEIPVEWMEYEVPLELHLKYKFPTLMRGETYAIGIVWNYCDGTNSPVFHIPAGVAGASGPVSAESTLPTTGNAAEDFDTTGQFERLRDPSNSSATQESDKLENQIEIDIDAITTNEADLIAATACLDCPAATQAMTDDLDDISDIIQSQTEIIAGYGEDDPDPDVNTTSSWKDAIKRLINAVKNREYITRKRPVLTYSDPNPTEGAGGASIPPPQPKIPAGIRGDNWVDSFGNNLIEGRIKLLDSGPTEVYESDVDYPNDTDCKCERYFPEGKTKHHKIPLRPHFVSYQNGVVNKYQPENYEYGHTYVRLLGLRLGNIHFPTEADGLPKPLCPNSPFKIVYVERTDHNKSVFAKGWCAGVFEGDVYGKHYLYGRHGVNSKHHVDRFIASGVDGTSRLGTQSDLPFYMFHSPDTDLDKSYLPVTHVRPELELNGSGWLHGLYAVGRAPQNPTDEGRIDQRGARVSNNLNHYIQSDGENIELKAVSYLPGDVVMTAGDFDFPIMNRYRESCVAIQAALNLPGDDLDNSFPGGTLDHFGPTTCNAPYVALVRDLKDQYGSVDGLTYIELGLKATKAHVGAMSVIEGICGDAWIGPYSKRRTSYVSNKQGDFFNVPAKPGAVCRVRAWYDSPADKIIEYFGIDFYPTKLPESGDIYDPKNYAGLHTANGAACGAAVSKNFAGSAAAEGTESDLYWPRLLKSLVHCMVESHVNPWLRQTGNVPGEVFYPKLKDLYLDSDAPSSHPWEDSYLNRFYCKIAQPSKKQLAKKAWIRSLLGLILPAGFMSLPLTLGNPFDITAWPLVTTGLSGLWVAAINLLFTNSKLNEMFGIGEGHRDEEGGDLDDCIEQWEDNYNRYNWDYSKPNNIIPYYAFTLPYMTCLCGLCEKGDMNGRGRQLTNEIYYSNKQNLDSEIDAYKNVKINNYNEIPAHSGGLQKLFVQGSGFYAHTTDGIWLLRLAQPSVPQDITSQLSGTGLLLDEPILIFEGVTEGFCGTSHPNASINTAFGYFFVDDNAKKIYRFNGNPEEISNYGMFHFFKEKLDFCSPGECFDEKQGTHYSLGWDYRLNRLLVTKKGSFTLSYDPTGIPIQGGGARGKWVSFHSYNPNDYFWDRNDLYSFEGSQVYKHNVGETHLPFSVTLVAANEQTYRLSGLMLNTSARKDGLKDLDLTFDKVAIWNSTQGTGTRPIIPISDNAGERTNPRERSTTNAGQIRFYKNKRFWTTGELHDLIKSDCVHLPLRLETECGIEPTINEGIFDCDVLSSQDYNKRILEDTYTYFKYSLDRTDFELYFLNQTIK